MLNEILQLSGEQIEIRTRLGGQGARKIHVMMRIAQPLQWRKQNVAAHTRLGAPDNFAQQQAVRMQRHMMPVLFVGGYGKHHRRIWRQRLNLWPFHVGELHGK